MLKQGDLIADNVPTMMEARRMRGKHVALPIAGLLIAMLSIQSGASLAKSIFPVAGPLGTAALRIVLASLFMAMVLAPWKSPITRSNWRPLLLYGAALGGMNLTFYKAIETIPLGIAVAIEFVGPLGVAIATSRKRSDFLWIALAMGGLAMLVPWGDQTHALDLAGMGFALCAGLCWGLYIIFGQRAGHDHGTGAAAYGMIVAAVIAVPAGIAQSGGAMFNAAIFPVALGVALLSSALPYTLEMAALRRLATPTFGTLMSLEPAIAALTGYLLLNESLPLVHWLAIATIMVASAGAAMTATPASRPLDAP